MSDAIECSNCDGTGLDPASIRGRLDLVCGFCHGVGWVGGEWGEPAERGGSGWSEVDPTDAEPVWESAGAREDVCRQCQGAGHVLSMDGAVRGGTARRLGYLTCPACQGLAARPNER